jgi:WD40 repeat protein
VPAAAPAIPPQIPDYELLRLVGQGAYGDVWLARSITGVYRAVKVVWRQRFDDSHPYEREFSGLRDYARVSINEARQLALLHVGRNDGVGFFYYVMELADDAERGRAIDPAEYTPLTLKRYLERGLQLPVRQVVDHGVELARALANLHSHGLVHRDIKPSNLIVVDGQPKLADIGLVAAATSARSFVGTEGFVPPEGPGTPAADVYSLGKVLYELAMGRDRNDYPRLPEDFQQRADAPELIELNEVIVRACDPSLAVRYADAEALLHELLLLQAGRSVRRLRLAERGLARARRVGVALALIAAIGFSGAYLERGRAEREAAGRKTAEMERDQLARLTVYSGGLSRVQRALETGDYGRAREVLRELAPPGELSEDLRGFEWRALWHEAQGDPAEVIRDGGPSVERVEYSPDGDWFVVHDNSKTAMVYRSDGREPVRIIRGMYRFGGFSSDGRWLIGTTTAHLLQAWDTTTGEPIGEPQGAGFNHPICLIPGERAQVLTFTVNSKADPPTLRIWDLGARSEIKNWPILDASGPGWNVRVVGVSTDATSLSLLTLQDAAHMGIFRQVLIHLNTSSTPIRWQLPSETGKTFESDVIRAAIERFRVETSGQNLPLRDATHSPSELSTIAFSSDKYLLAAASTAGVISVIDTGTGLERHRLVGHAGAVMAIAWSPDNSSLMTADNAGHVRRWRAPFPPATDIVEGVWPPERDDARVQFSLHDPMVFAASANEELVLYSSDSLQQQGVRRNAKMPLAFGLDNSMFSLSELGHLQKWQADGELITEAPFGWPAGVTTEAVMDLGGTLIAAISDRCDLLIGKTGASEVVMRQEVGGTKLHRLVMSSNGAYAAAVVDGIKVQIWDARDGQEVGRFNFIPLVENLSFSRDGKVLAVCLINGDVSIIDVLGAKTDRTFRVSNAAVSAAFTPDNSRLVFAARNGLLHVYRTLDWREVATLDDHRSSNRGQIRVASVGFSPDGKILTVHRHDGRLRLWRAP